MRDIIWTIIGIWLVYKFIDIFKSAGSKKQTNPSYDNNSSKNAAPNGNSSQKRYDNEGEYVDYEEIK